MFKYDFDFNLIVYLPYNGFVLLNSDSITAIFETTHFIDLSIQQSRQTSKTNSIEYNSNMFIV